MIVNYLDKTQCSLPCFLLEFPMKTEFHGVFCQDVRQSHQDMGVSTVYLTLGSKIQPT